MAPVGKSPRGCKIMAVRWRQDMAFGGWFDENPLVLIRRIVDSIACGHGLLPVRAYGHLQPESAVYHLRRKSGGWRHWTCRCRSHRQRNLPHGRTDQRTEQRPCPPAAQWPAKMAMSTAAYRYAPGREQPPASWRPSGFATNNRRLRRVDHSGAFGAKAPAAATKPAATACAVHVHCSSTFRLINGLPSVDDY